MKNIDYLKGFIEFTNISILEAVQDTYGFDEWFSQQGEKSTDLGKAEGELYIYGETPKELEAAEELKNAMLDIDDSKADADLAKGASILQANWNKAWEIRKELDLGELTKKGDWYIGKGAWRINSNKADYLGLTPKWMTWHDNLQDDILQSFFPEVLQKGKSIDKEETEDDVKVDDVDLQKLGLDSDELGIELDKEIEDRELELAPMESLKYIHRLFEAEPFSLGPASGKTAREAVVVTPTDLERRLIMNYKMSNRRNVMIWGAPGIGKTEIVKQIALKIGAELNKDIPVVVITLAQMEPVDLNGVPLLFSKEGEEGVIARLDMRGKIFMDFAVPGWLPGSDSAEEGILFFDEINNASNYVLSAALTLLLDRQSQGGNYQMPSGWRIWAAGNRAVDSIAITPLEGRVARRFTGGHLHLVPTIGDWIRWTRSESGYHRDVNNKITKEFYVPDEFKLFLEQMEGSSADTTKGKKDDSDGIDKIPLYLDRAGKEIKTRFKYFYNFDKDGLTTSGEGVTVGFANPASWTAGFSNIYDAVLNNYRDKVEIIPKETDSRYIGLMAFTIALNDIEGRLDIAEQLETAVGREATQSFMDFIKILAKYTDSKSTLNDKLNNIFKGKDPRPMVGGKKASDKSERMAILGLVESHMDSIGETINSKHWVAWMRYIEDLGTNIEEGEIAAHVSSVSTHNNPKVIESLVVMITAATTLKHTGKSSIPKEDAAYALKFFQKFKDLLGGFDI